jgi:phosphotransferase system enzyme I (PtsI)
VIIADDLSPIEIIQLIQFNPVGIILENCGKFSHTAIIAANAPFPVIILKTELCDYLKPFEKILFNHEENALIIRPTEEEVIRSKEIQRHESLTPLSSLLYKESSIRLLSNIEPCETIGSLHEQSQGYGLIRTEFLYFQNTHPPEEQIITNILEKICLKTPAHYPITIRTPDLGGDKTPLFYTHFFEKYQSSLSLRGIGLTLKHPEILIPNLRSILCLSERFKNIRILLPMVKTIDDIAQTKKLIHHLIKDLQNEKLISQSYKRPLIGAMIEVPAVAICADQLAPHCDFFSIGGNDLIQFTMAADRNDKNQQDYFINHPEAIFRLIENTVKFSKKFHKIPTTICGDFRNPSYIFRLLECGIRDFSTAHNQISEFIKNIHSLNNHRSDKIIVPA